MTEKLVKEIRKARPTLRQVSPLSHWIVAIMGLFNIILGISFLLAIDKNRVSAPLLIVNDYLSFEFWGVVFIAIGLIKFYSLVTNSWMLSRQTLLMGVSVKAAWAVALTVRSFVSPGTIFLNLLWVTIAAIQMACYIYFMPPSTEKYKQRRTERDAQ